VTAREEELHYSSLKDQLALSDARKTRYCHYNKCYKLTEYSGGQEQHNNAGEPEDWRGTGLKLVKCDSSKSNRRSARSSITSRPGTRSAYTYEQLAWLLRSPRGGRPGSFTPPPITRGRRRPTDIYGFQATPKVQTERLACGLAIKRSRVRFPAAYDHSRQVAHTSLNRVLASAGVRAGMSPLPDGR